MSDDTTVYTSFLGTGWSFPPEFTAESGEVLMTSDQADIEASLWILLGTSAGERFMNPKYGLGMRDMLFEPLNTTAQTFLKDRIKTAILIYEPRVQLLSVDLYTSGQYEGLVEIAISYMIRTTNSRYNLVYPFYTTDSNELRGTVV